MKSDIFKKVSVLLIMFFCFAASSTHAQTASLVVTPSSFGPVTLSTPQTYQIVIGDPDQPGPISWTAAIGPDLSWVSVDTTNGIANPISILNITLDPTGLPPGTYSGYVTIAPDSTDYGQPKQVTFQLTVSATSLQVTPSSIGPVTFADSNSRSYTVLVGNSNTDTNIAWSAVSDVEWISIVDSTTGTANGTASPMSTVFLILDPAGSDLAPGSYTGKVTFVPNNPNFGPSVTVTVTITVSATSLQVTPSGIGPVEISDGIPQTYTVLVGNENSPNPIQWSAIPSSDWIKVNPSSGTANPTSNLQITLDPAGLPAGDYTGVVIITPSNPDYGPPTTVSISLTIPTSAVTSLLLVSPSKLDVQFNEDELSTAKEFPVVIKSADPLNQDFRWSSVSDVSWLSISPSESPAGVTTGPYNATVTVDPTRINIPSGQTQVEVTGTIRIISSLAEDERGETTLTVNVTILRPQTFSVSPSTLELTVPRIAGKVLQYQIVVQTEEDVEWRASVNRPWLSLESAEGTGPTVLTLSVTVPEVLENDSFEVGLVEFYTRRDNQRKAAIDVTLRFSDSQALFVSPEEIAVDVNLPAGSTLTYQLVVQGPEGSEWITSIDRPWLSITPQQGTTTSIATLTVTIPSGLPDTGDVGTITFHGVGPDVEVKVYLNSPVSAQAFYVSPTNIVLNISLPLGKDALTYQIAVQGDEGLPWEASSDVNWLSVSPAAGSVPSIATLTVTTVGDAAAELLRAGLHTGKITFTSSGGLRAVVTVNFTNTEIDNFAVSPSRLDINAALLPGEQLQYQVAVQASDPTEWTASTDKSWLSISPASETTPSVTTLVVTMPADLPEAGDIGIVSFFKKQPNPPVGETPVPDATITVYLYPGPPSPAQNFSVSPVEINAAVFVPPGDSQTFNYQISVQGINGAGWTASTDQYWLSVTSSGTIPSVATLAVNVSEEMLAGTYQGTVVFSSEGDTISVPVTLTLSRSTEAFRVNPSKVDLGTLAPGEAPSSIQVAVQGTPGTTWTAATNQTWLSVEGDGNIPGIATITVTPGNLSQGSYTGEVTFYSGNQSATVTVTFVVGEAAPISVSPAVVDLGVIFLPPGEATTFPLVINILGEEGDIYSWSTDREWISFEPSIVNSAGLPVFADDGIGRGTVTIGISSVLPSGNYTGNLTFFSRDQTATFTVTFELDRSGRIAVNPEEINLGNIFLAPNTASAPYTFLISVEGTYGAEWNASTNQTWLTVTESGTIATVATLTVTIPADLLPGDYEGTASFFTGESENSTATVKVTFTLIRSPTGSGLLATPTYIKTYFIAPFSPQSFPVEIMAADPGITDFTWTAYTPYPWITVEPSAGTGPATVVMTIDPSKLPFTEDLLFTQDPETANELGALSVLFFTSSIGDASVALEVTFSKIGDELIVSPSAISALFTKSNPTPRDFPVDIRNANPANQEFDWVAESPAPWLTLIPSSGTGAATATLRIDPLLIPSTETEITVEVPIRSSLDVLNPDQIDEEDVVKKITVTVFVYSAQEFSVSPSFLFFSQEALEVDGVPQIPDFTSQSVIVSAGAQGWSASFNAPWMTVTLGGTAIGPLSTSDPEGYLTVQPVTSVLTYGRFESSIKIVDRQSGVFRLVPVIVEIRRPGEESSIPVPSPDFLQTTPGFVLVEAADANRLDMAISLNSMVSGDKAYVLLEVPSLVPGVVFAYTPYKPKPFQIISINGIPTPEANSYYYSSGPIGEVPIRGLYLRGLSGEFLLTTKVGPNLANSREVQRVAVNITTPIGTWQITDRYEGESYTYDARIFNQISNSGYEGTWYNVPVNILYGDTRTHLYRIQFKDSKNLNFLYDITSLTPFEMKGRWTAGGEDFSPPRNDFWGQRVLTIQ